MGTDFLLLYPSVLLTQENKSEIGRCFKNVFYFIFWIDEIPEPSDLPEPMQRRLEVMLWAWLALVPLQLALLNRWWTKSLFGNAQNTL